MQNNLTNQILVLFESLSDEQKKELVEFAKKLVDSHDKNGSNLESYNKLVNSG